MYVLVVFREILRDHLTCYVVPPPPAVTSCQTLFVVSISCVQKIIITGTCSLIIICAKWSIFCNIAGVLSPGECTVDVYTKHFDFLGEASLSCEDTEGNVRRLAEQNQGPGV